MILFQFVHLHLLYLNIPAGCNDDMLRIYDGDSILSNRLEKFCGREEDLHVFSSGRHLFVHFVSDDKREKKGFRFTYDFFPLFESKIFF